MRKIKLAIIAAVVVTIVNDTTAVNVAKEIETIPLPQNTIFVESISKAGKLVGNGNGMQYYGAMLISSELSLDELQEHYSKYACEVSMIDYPRIDVDHGELSFKTEVFPDNAFIVEKWGKGVSWFFTECDIRGH